MMAMNYLWWLRLIRLFIELSNLLVMFDGIQTFRDRTFRDETLRDGRFVTRLFVTRTFRDKTFRDKDIS